ncbi:MAG: hypothetical protein JOZ99_03740 [Actinobacteria bacterium]|nr:hypothetical protein [Actinomycetota bacterium]
MGVLQIGGLVVVAFLVGSLFVLRRRGASPAPARRSTVTARKSSGV